jgi:transcriptional regulator with XRE-family HTH domain
MSIADKVRERIEALDTNPAELARRAGLARTFVSDLLAGKKKSVRGEGLMALANALACDPEYLTGGQATPRAQKPKARSTVPVVGVCETGVWRPASKYTDLGEFPIQTDPRFPVQDQVAFLARGAGASEIGIADGTIVCGIKPPKDGTIPAEFAGAPLIVRQSRRGGGDSETSIRLIEVSLKGALLVAPSPEKVPPIRFPSPSSEPEVTILAIVSSAVRVFGNKGGH